MTLGAHPLGSRPLGAGADKVVLDAIQETELIPYDSKIAIKDFIKESFNELWSNFNELLSITPPPELIEYWDVVIQIIQQIS